MDVALNGKMINLAKALPLRLRDWKALEAAGITAGALQQGRITEAVAVILFVLQKADPTVTAEEVDDLALTDPLIRTVLEALREETIDRPFSTLSTPSPAPTAGPDAT